MSTDGPANTDDTAGHEAPRPVLRIVRGDPTPEELAALVAVVTGVSAAAASATKTRRPRSEWSTPARSHRTPLAPGLGGWRASALPR